MDIEAFGAIKITDGLFIGDEFAAQDLEFVVTNKITHIINTAGRQVPNHWEPIGVRYLTYHWLDHESQIIFDQKDTVFNAIFTFIRRAVTQAESVLVHSVRGQSRSAIIITAFLMRRYQWNLQKTLEFMNQRRPDLDMRNSFVRQLSSLEGRLTSRGLGPKSNAWNELSNENDSEEIMLRNTFLNAQITEISDLQLEDGLEQQEKIRWADEAPSPAPPESKTQKEETKIVKSCLKGSDSMFEFRRAPVPSKPAPGNPYKNMREELKRPSPKKTVPEYSAKSFASPPRQQPRVPIVSNSAKAISKSLDSGASTNPKIRTQSGKKIVIQKKRPGTVGVRPEPEVQNERRPVRSGKKGKKPAGGTTKNIYGLRL